MHRQCSTAELHSQLSAHPGSLVEQGLESWKQGDSLFFPQEYRVDGDHGPGVSAVKMTAIEILGCLFGGEMGGAGGVKGCGPTPPRFLN